MKKILIFGTFCIFIVFAQARSFAGMYDYLEPKANEVFIGSACIEVPLGNILLIRKDTHCCALKFTRHWTEVDEKERERYAPLEAQGGIAAEIAKRQYTKKYAAYDVYYQGDVSADVLRSNVVRSEHIASWLPLRGPFRPFIYQPGDSYVRCGPFKLGWEYEKKVCFIPSGKGLGDYGFELAPTPWTELSQVDISDLRLRWYRYDARRERAFIPIDKLWEDKK